MNLLFQLIEQRTGKELTKRDLKAITELFDGSDGYMLTGGVEHTIYRRWNGKMQLNDKVQHVYLVGAKSLGAYGGYETFVYKLTEYHQNKENIKYHVACKANGDGCMRISTVTRLAVQTPR